MTGTEAAWIVLSFIGGAIACILSFGYYIKLQSKKISEKFSVDPKEMDQIKETMTDFFNTIKESQQKK